MTRLTVKVKGTREARAKFRAMKAAGESDAILDPAVRAGALVIENAAKQFAPKKSGTLARSITSERAN